MRFRSLLPFLLITFGLAWGLLVLLAVYPPPLAELFGEVRMTNPLFVLAVYAPALAAIVLVAAEAGISGVQRLLSRVLLWRAPLVWYLFLLLGLPLLFFGGAALKGTGTSMPVTLSAALPALAITLVIGPVEEIGWRGMALPLLQQRFTPIVAGLLLGIIWSLWHLPAFFLGGTPQSAWSFWPYFVGATAASVIITPMFNAARGSILLPALFHYQMNNPLFPDAQPYDSLFFALAAIVVVILNRRTLFTRGGVQRVI